MNIEKFQGQNWLKIVEIALLIAGMAGCGGGGNTDDDTALEPPPTYSYAKPAEINDGWVTAHAADLGVDVALLEEMIVAVPRDFDIVDSVAISYQGSLILDETLRVRLNEFDAWVNNTDPDMHVMFSASKSLASLAVGIAIDLGIFSGVEIPYLDLFDYASYDNWDERKNDIVLKDVLTMRLGLDWDEWDPPYSSPDNQMLRFYATETDYSKSMLDRPMVAEPGTLFAYSTPASVSLGQAIENAGPLALIDFGIANVFLPLDITNVEVFRTPTGLPDIGRGLFLTTRDFLKFGQLYANRGTWNGQRIVSDTWVDASTTAYTEFGWTEPDRFDWQVSGYGYQWWTGSFEVDGESIESFAARGHGQQVLMVIPELDLVIAVFSHAFDSADDEVNQVFRMISQYIIPALPTN